MSLLVALPKGINAQPASVSPESTHYPLLIIDEDPLLEDPLLIVKEGNGKHVENKDIWQWIKDNIEWFFSFVGVGGGGLFGLYELLKIIDERRFKQHLLTAFEKDLDTDTILKNSFKNRLKKVLDNQGVFDSSFKTLFKKLETDDELAGVFKNRIETAIKDDLFFEDCLNECLDNLQLDLNHNLNLNLQRAFDDSIRRAIGRDDLIKEKINDISQEYFSNMRGYIATSLDQLSDTDSLLNTKIKELEQEIDTLKSNPKT